MKVDVQAVEEELARIQRELTHEVRTSLFNLVVMSPDAQQQMVDDTLNYLLGKRAARVIHVANRNVAQSRIDVSARCFVDRERKGVCFQEIIITNGRDGAGGAPGTWIPLLVRDIPTHVLWLDTLSGKEALFSHVRNQADKIIVDADHCVELGDDPEAVLAALRRASVEEAVPLADFSWRRLRPYRRLTALAFDGERAERLDEITRVEVTGLAPMSARYLGLWLAERLGWTQDGPFRFRDIQGRLVQMKTTAAAPDCDASIRFLLGAVHRGGRAVEVRASQDGCADLEYPGGAEEQVVTVPSSGEILLEEVDAVYADSLFRDALAASSLKPAEQ